MQRLRSLRRSTALFAAGALAFGACGNNGDASSTGAAQSPPPTDNVAANDDSSGDGADEVAAPLRRLVLADDGEARLVMIDLDENAARHELELAWPASYASSVTENGRHVLLAHENAVSVVDGGTWSEGHTDHQHHFVADPEVVGTVDGERPTHLISHDDAVALWFDGLGEAVLLDEDSLAEGEVKENARVPTPEPHHGFAIPHGEDVVLTVPPTAGEEMPGRVAIASRSGEIESEYDCLQTHGEASWSTGAAACADGVLVLRDADGGWSGDLMPYPNVDDADPYGYGAARAWVLEPIGDGSQLIAPLGEHHVLVLDVATGDTATVDVGAPVAIFGVGAHADSGHLVVLTDDGAVQLVDPTSGDVVDRVQIIEPAADGDERYRMLAVSGDDVFVSDPAGQAVVQLTAAADGLSVGPSLELGFSPSFLGVLNG